MCLTTVDKKTKYKNRRIGYKSMALASYGTLRGSYYPCRGKVVGKSYTDRSTRTLATRHPTRPYSTREIEYPTGFHIYLDEQDAHNATRYGTALVVVRVKFSKVVASGTQGMRKESIVVARQMTIQEIL